MSTRAVGGVLLVGAAGAGAWWLWAEGGNPLAKASGVLTRAGGGAGSDASRAQIVQDLEQELADLESRRERERARIESEYGRREARATFTGIQEQVRQRCEVVFGFNPWGDCDDQLLREVKAENEAWRERQLNLRVRPLDADIRSVQAELDSVWNEI